MFALTAIFGMFAEIFCLLLATATIRYMRMNSSSYSPQTYRMQLQLTVLLIVQLILPLIFVVLPLLYRFYPAYCTVLGISACRAYVEKLGVGAKIFPILLLFYPALNSALTLFFVAPYRHALRRMLLPCSSKYRPSVSAMAKDGPKPTPI